MIEPVLEFLLAFFFEGLLAFVGDLLFSSIWESMFRRPASESADDWTERALFSTIWIIGGGVGIGLITVAIVPQRVFPTMGFRGVSLLLSPLVTGFLMSRYGAWRERRGMAHSSFTTFWAGALFAFSMAAVRFLSIK